MRRHESFNEHVSREIRESSEAAAGFLEGLMAADDITLAEAMIDVIEVMGINEFSEFTGVAQPTVSAFINGKRRGTDNLLNQFLKPFGLQVKKTIVKAG